LALYRFNDLTVPDKLEYLDVMLHVIKGFGDELPAACQNTCQEAWVLFDALIAKYGYNFNIGDRATRVLRYGIDLFGKVALPLAPRVLERLATAFDAWDNSGYVWILGKLICKFGNEEDPVLREAFRRAFEMVSAKMMIVLQQGGAMTMPDGE